MWGLGLDMQKVRCSITFYYDPETYLHDWDDEDEFNLPSEETIFERCKKMMLEDITDYQNPITIEAIHAEFIVGKTDVLYKRA
jgi:hypothetical protein